VSSPENSPVEKGAWAPSLDEWAVAAALLLAFLVKVGIPRFDFAHIQGLHQATRNTACC